MDLKDLLVLIKGAGDLASGVAGRLYRSGLRVAMTELPQPLMVRRTVSFGEAIYAGEVSVEGIRGRRVPDADAAAAALAAGIIPVLVDPQAACRFALKPAVLVDGVMAKRNIGTARTDATLVIALGPGFVAGADCHAVIETQRGHWLGRVIWQGAAQADTGAPGEVRGVAAARVLRAPVSGVFESAASIGDFVTAGQVLGVVAGVQAQAGCDGILRGLLRPGLWVAAGAKIGDVDPRGQPAHCFTISDKALAVGGGVLEAIGAWWSHRAI